MPLTQAIILHGTDGSPDGNWFRWLERRLRDKGFRVWVPKLPHAASPSLREEMEYVQTHTPFPLDERTLVIGHSSGATLALVLAQNVARPIGAVVAVSPFVPMPATYPATEWEANNRLFDVTWHWPAIRRGAQKFFILYSDDDPYIPLSVFDHIATRIDAERILLPSQGHFNTEKSQEYQRFPLLFSLLMERGLVPHGDIQIVDEHDRPLRAGTMQEAQAKGLWHRIVRVIVDDGEGNVLAQKRAAIMFMNPGRWDNSCSGHVDVGEEWMGAALRELREEIGLDGVTLQEWQRYKREVVEPDGRIIRRFNTVYRTTVPHTTKFVIQPEEVSEVRWFSRKELRELISAHPETVTRGFQNLVEDLYDDYQHHRSTKES